MMTTTTVKHISCVDTAKLVRAALKQGFPDTTFSVTCKGNAIRVRWRDGPASPTVREITDQFVGSSFDSMIDLKSNREHIVDGQRVQYGSDYVFAERTYSDDFLGAIAAEVAAQHGLPAPTIEPTPWGPLVGNQGVRVSEGRGEFLVDLIMRKAHDTMGAEAVR